MTFPASSSGAVDLAPSFIRTAVPLIVGPLIARYGFDVDDTSISLIVSAVAAWLYYVVVRVLELKAPRVGYLLGLAKQPTYVSPPAVVTDEDGTRTVGGEAGEEDFSAGG